jgi:O-antigen chain-terminating methyltransferase
VIERFYQVLEDRYRGSRELIRSRLQVYLPFVEPLKTLDDAQAAVDLGCGRGEWLELLQQHGFRATGVDLNDLMIAGCRDRNLVAIRADSVDHLKTLPADRQGLVSAIHLVEHLDFADLQQLVTEAHRVLMPGGLLILETPNPENLIVATSSFYLDPTHRRPLPEGLLRLVVEYAGFRRVKTLYLQEDPALATAWWIGLHDVLAGVSPDYAVVAQKAAADEVLGRFDRLFSKSYGIGLHALAKRYDRQSLRWWLSRLSRLPARLKRTWKSMRSTRQA